MTPTPEIEKQIAEAFDAWWRTVDQRIVMRATAFRAGAVSQLARVEALDRYREKLNQEHTEALQEMVKVEAERNELRLEASNAEMYKSELDQVGLAIGCEHIEGLARCVRDVSEERGDLKARIANLESERDNWRVSSVCREKQARIDALEKERDEWKAKWEDLNRHIQLRDLRR